MLIPIGILWPRLKAPDGFGEIPVELPFWWTEPTVVRRVPSTPVIEKRPKRQTKTPQLKLFDRPPAPSGKMLAEELCIKDLLQSEVFSEQKKRLTGRVPIDDTMVQRPLTALAGRGGSMTTAALAGAIEVPEHRLSGLLAVMQRLLNIEGYAILDRQKAANTVSLNIPHRDCKKTQVHAIGGKPHIEAKRYKIFSVGIIIDNLAPFNSTHHHMAQGTRSIQPRATRHFLTPILKCFFFHSRVCQLRQHNVPDTPR